MNSPLHPRGFANSRIPVELPAEVAHFIQGPTKTGSFCVTPELHHTVAETADLTVMIFGHAHHVIRDDSDDDLINSASKIADVWATFGTTGVEWNLYDLAGRFGVLILSADGSYLHQDGPGLRPINCTTGNEAAVEFPLSGFDGSRLRADIKLQIANTYSRHQGEAIVGDTDRIRCATNRAAGYFPLTTNARDQSDGCARGAQKQGAYPVAARRPEEVMGNSKADTRQSLHA